MKIKELNWSRKSHKIQMVTYWILVIYWKSSIDYLLELFRVERVLAGK